MTRPVDKAIKIGPVLVLLVAVGITVHPSLSLNREALFFGWLLAALLFYPSILAQKYAVNAGHKLSMYIPLAMTVVRMMAITTSLFLLTKFMKHWLVPFSIGLLLSFPAWIIFEMRSMKLQQAIKREA